MIQKKFVFTGSAGMETRQAFRLVSIANSFESDVNLIYKGNSFSAKSLLIVLGSGIEDGEEFELTVSGNDETQAMQTLETAIEEGL